jgi:aquaporin Z
MLGAIIASTVIFAVFGEDNGQGATVPHLGFAASFAIELVLTFILMLVIFNVSTGHQEKGIMAGAAVGATVFFNALIGGPLTGASMNPARSLAPAIYAGELQNYWIYFFAPVLGALLASPFCRWVQGDDCCQEQS